MKKLFLLFLLFLPISLFSQNIDFRILHSINSPQVLPSDGFFRFMSNSDMYVITGVPVTMAIVGLANHDDKLLRNAGVVATGTIINFGITAGLKYLFKRKRPFTTYPGIIVNKSGSPCNDPSFPSGHTSTSFMLATSLSLQYPKWYVIAPAYLYAGTVAYSRMDLGVHYPSDVLSGAIIGSGSAYITYKINRKIKW
jgi:membrane-associated phospholipid phosphatase